MDSFGAAMRKLQQMAGHSQEDLAAIGQAISNIANGTPIECTIVPTGSIMVQVDEAIDGLKNLRLDCSEWSILLNPLYHALLGDECKQGLMYTASPNIVTYRGMPVVSDEHITGMRLSKSVEVLS